MKNTTRIDIKAYANADSTTVVWRFDKPIAHCLGFALHRRAAGGGDEVVIENRIGFQGDPQAAPGAHRSSDEWPIQRMIWSDYTAAGAGQVQYRVVAKLGKPGALQDGAASDWCDAVEVGTGKSDGFKAYFNRGIVPAQYMARTGQAMMRGKPADVEQPGHPLRKELGGTLLSALTGLLKTSHANGETFHAALYELNDVELIDALKAFGERGHLLLGSGAYGTKKGRKVTDENADVRKALKASRTIAVYDRLVSSPHFAHNKFVVFCDAQQRPVRVWTGSTNWTVSGLCTQVNNGLLVESPELAQAYLSRWQALMQAKHAYPPSLAQQGSVPAHATVGAGKTTVTAWNVPCEQQVDLADVRRLIQGARQGVLFLFFNPGPKGTLLNDILALDQNNLYIHGVVNADPGGNKAPILTLHEHGNRIDAEPEVSLPANINEYLSPWFQNEPAGPMVMIHSKVVVIDPFGSHPVVMTGSHNLGSKASKSNDDNLLIIENAPGLAQEYAVNIMGVFDHYKFRQLHHVNAKAAKSSAAKPAKWGGLQSDDSWQEGYFQAAHQRELAFWMGEEAARRLG
jgi:phosphatidylserine/phosphatidylglycerophosphate/cardiolipin synthase-like enzyme